MRNLSQSKSNFRNIMIIALPIIIQSLVVQFQTLINRVFLGNSKVEYLSAVGNSIFPYYATITIVIAASVGLTILIAQNMGAQKSETAEGYVHASIFYSSILSLALFVLWFFFPNIIFLIMDVDKGIIGYCVGYVKIISFSLIFLGIDTTLQAMLQGVGLTKPIMYSGIAKILLNILLDWVLIYGKLGFSPLGIYGAALATAISNTLAIIFLVLYTLNSKKLPFKIRLSGVWKSRSFNLFRDVLKVGLPTGVESFVWYGGVLVLLRILNSLDSLAVGIYTLIYGIDIAVYGVYNGLAKASLTLVGNKIGEDNEKEARRILTSCLKYNYVLVTGVFLLFIMFSKQILGIFTKDAFMINESVVFLAIMSFTLFPRSLNVVVGSGIRGLGDTRWMLYTQILGTAMVLVLASFTVLGLGLGIMGIYITIFFDEFIRSVINTIHFFKRDRRSAAHKILVKG